MHASGRNLLLSALFCLALVDRAHAGRFAFGWVRQGTMAPSNSASPSPPQATPTSPSPAPSPLPQDGAVAPTQDDVSDLPFIPFDELNIPNLEDILNIDATDDDDGDEEEEQVQPRDATPINSTVSKALPTESAVPSASVESAATPETATAASSSSCDYRCLLSFCINMPGLCEVRIIEAGDEYCRFLSGCPPGRPPFSRIYIPFSPPFRSSAQSAGANPFSFSPTEGSTSSPNNPFEG